VPFVAPRTCTGKKTIHLNICYPETGEKHQPPLLGFKESALRLLKKIVTNKDRSGCYLFVQKINFIDELSYNKNTKSALYIQKTL
jgi:hypothetical protein